MAFQELCEEIGQMIADYRAGEIPPPNAQHVKRWVDQFPAGVREPLLREMKHVLGETYTSKVTVKAFLEVVATSANLVGEDPRAFWMGVRFLRLQQVGNSQVEMLNLFDMVLQERLGISLNDCGANPHTFVYLDDGVFSGGRLKSDILRWIQEEAPANAQVAVIVMALHNLGEYFAMKDIAAAAAVAGKTISLQWWSGLRVEDRKAYMGQSDVLRPKTIPAEAASYVATLGAEPILRTGNSVGQIGVFSSPEGRELLEQEFLKAGVRVRQLCPLLNAYMRPLGCTLLRTTGFGSTFVTYRNIANNTPLVLWAGNPWYPLFPRRTN